VADPLYAELAKEQQRLSPRRGKRLAKSGQPFHTDQALAELAGVSTGTLHAPGWKALRRRGRGVTPRARHMQDLGVHRNVT
jgi:hypothetical protein